MRINLLCHAFAVLFAIGFHGQPPEKIDAEFVKLPPVHGDYKCILIRVIDGDSFVVGLIQPLKIRLRNTNAIELKNQGGPEAKRALEKMLPRPVPISEIRLYGPDKFFGRAVGDMQTERGEWASEEMISGQWAARWDKPIGPKPVPAPKEEQ